MGPGEQLGIERSSRSRGLHLVQTHKAPISNFDFIELSKVIFHCHQVEPCIFFDHGDLVAAYG
jgi:hypothetical protein